MSWLADPILDSVQGFLLWLISLFPGASSLPVPSFAPWFAHLNIFVDMTLLTSLVGTFLAYEGLVLVVRAFLLLWGTLKP